MTNVVTNVGLDEMMELLLADMSYLGVGSGTSTPAVTDTALGSEISRVASVNMGASATGGTATGVVEAFFNTSQGNGTIRELGLFDAASGGNMHARCKLASEVVKTAGKQLRVTVTFKARWVTAFT